MTMPGHAALAGTPFCVIQAGKEKSRLLAEAVIAGCGGGEIGYGTPLTEIAAHHTPVIIGPHPTTVETLWDLHRAKRPYVTVDNGYYRPYKSGGYFRMTTNAMQWIGAARGYVGREGGLPEGPARFAALDLAIQAQRDPGDGPILIVQQSATWMDMMNEPAAWAEWVKAKIARYTDRAVIIRHKPLKGAAPQPPIDEQIAAASGVVGFSSAALVQAAMAGVPTYALAHCAASPMAHPIVDVYINQPRVYERLPYLHDLAANQWTIEEIASGDAWRALVDRYQPEFMRPA